MEEESFLKMTGAVRARAVKAAKDAARKEAHEKRIATREANMRMGSQQGGGMEKKGGSGGCTHGMGLEGGGGPGDLPSAARGTNGQGGRWGLPLAAHHERRRDPGSSAGPFAQ